MTALTPEAMHEIRARHRQALGLAGGFLSGLEATDERKQALTARVETLERMLSQGLSHDVVRAHAASLRQDLMSGPAWTDGWLPWDDWSPHAELLERVNRVQRLSIAKHRPGVIHPDVILPDGSVLQQSPVAAGLETFADEVSTRVEDLVTESAGALDWLWEHRKPLGALALILALVWAFRR